MSRIDAKCTHYNTNRGSIKCSQECKTVACQQCKITRKINKQNCEQCYRDRNANCTHSDSERSITGLWTIAEMEKALEKGYKIAKIYEVLHFGDCSTELWKEYITKFLKIKLESSEFTCSEEEYRKKRQESLVLSLVS